MAVSNYDFIPVVVQMCIETQKDKNQEINNRLMAAGEDRNSLLSLAKDLLSLPSNNKVRHKQHSNKGEN